MDQADKLKAQPALQASVVHACDLTSDTVHPSINNMEGV
jgi:hypothetical protein